MALNAFVGWYQEKQAGDIVEQLKAGIAMKATVVRGGKEQEIEARELVPGDIVVVEEGSTIPADGHVSIFLRSMALNDGLMSTLQIIAAYEDKDRSQAKSILDKRGQSDAKGGAFITVRRLLLTLISLSVGGSQNNGDASSARSDEKHAQDSEDKKEEPEAGDEKKVDKGPSILSCDQSAITGESLAVDKYIGDTIYYTTGAKRGKAYMVRIPVTKTVLRPPAHLLISGGKQHRKGVVCRQYGTACQSGIWRRSLPEGHDQYWNVASCSVRPSSQETYRSTPLLMSMFPTVSSSGCSRSG